MGIVRKTRYAGKEERGDGLEDKAEVRGEPVSCSDSALGDWLLLTGKRPGGRGPEVWLPSCVASFHLPHQLDLGLSDVERK